MRERDNLEDLSVDLSSGTEKGGYVTRSSFGQGQVVGACKCDNELAIFRELRGIS